MIPPLTAEEFEELMPQWVKDYRKVPHEEITLVEGMRVYDVLYGPKYHSPYGTIEEVWESSWGKGIRVLSDDGAVSITIGMYYIPLPAEHDPKGESK